MKKLLEELRAVEVSRKNLFSAEAIREAEDYLTELESHGGQQKQDELNRRLNQMEKEIDELKIKTDELNNKAIEWNPQPPQ